MYMFLLLYVYSLKWESFKFLYKIEPPFYLVHEEGGNYFEIEKVSRTKQFSKINNSTTKLFVHIRACSNKQERRAIVWLQKQNN